MILSTLFTRPSSAVSPAPLMWFWFVLAVFFIFLTSELPAQRPVPAGVTRVSSLSRNTQVDASTQNRPSKKTYVVVGALIGAAATIAGLSFFADVGSADVLVSPAAIAGALVGAGGGYLVYKMWF